MLPRDAIYAWRQRVDDLAGDYDPNSCGWEQDDTGLLWKNSEATDYLRTAQDAYCKLFPIREQVTISLVANQATYSLNAETGKRVVKVYPHPYIDNPLTPTTRQHLGYRTSYMGRSGSPKSYILENGNITLYPAPDAVGTLYLDVGRLPSQQLK